MATASRKERRERDAVAGKKKIVEAKGTMNLSFLKTMDETASAKDLEKFIMLLAESVNKEDPNTVRKCCETIGRMTQTDGGFFALYRAGTLETLNAVLENMEGVDIDVGVAYKSMVQQAANWVAGVDHVEFFKLPQVLDLASRFAGEYRSVALSAVSCLDRFAMQQAVHRLSILQSNGLNLLHRILSAHRSPEFCQETLMLIFHVCDVPAENVKPRLNAEISLIKSVVETLDAAPVNMRLQLAGLRLLTLWSNLGDKKINKAIQEAEAPETLKTAMANLGKAGFSHAAAWIDSIAGVALEPEKGYATMIAKKKKQAADKPGDEPAGDET